jgi:hypothetical protein
MLCGLQTMHAQEIDTLKLQGDLDKFYPVTFYDGGMSKNVATELELGRSATHLDSSWRGALIARFRFHVYNWGNAAHFIDADIRSGNALNQPNKFIAAWHDATTANSSGRIIIWLRGKTTYYYRSNYPVSPVVYDGVKNPLPYQETGGPAHTYRTAVGATVNHAGVSYNHTAYFNGTGVNYFAGSIAIGTTAPGTTYKLAVEGAIGARRIKVTQAAWADFVFQPDYHLPTLAELEKYVRDNRHLPEIPSAVEVARDGIDLGEMNKKLLQKIEELTLYLIEMQKKHNTAEQENRQIKIQYEQLLKRVEKLENPSYAR